MREGAEAKAPLPLSLNLAAGNDDMAPVSVVIYAPFPPFSTLVAEKNMGAAKKTAGE
jgi:hypothetical protein